jgi:hypothetical protein
MPSGKSDKWPKEDEDLLVQLLVECVQNGSIIRGTMNPELWVELTNVLNLRASTV